jgi:hypothetical protein
MDDDTPSIASRLTNISCVCMAAGTRTSTSVCPALRRSTGRRRSHHSSAGSGTSHTQVSRVWRRGCMEYTICLGAIVADGAAGDSFTACIDILYVHQQKRNKWEPVVEAAGSRQLCDGSVTSGTSLPPCCHHHTDHHTERHTDTWHDTGHHTAHHTAPCGCYAHHASELHAEALVACQRPAMHRVHCMNSVAGEKL